MVARCIPIEYAGRLGPEPKDIIKCETNDILVPANTEIVLEGRIPTGKTEDKDLFWTYRLRNRQVDQKHLPARRNKKKQHDLPQHHSD